MGKIIYGILAILVILGIVLIIYGAYNGPGYNHHYNLADISLGSVFIIISVAILIISKKQ